MTDQSSKSDLTNSAVLVMLVELTDEIAIGKRMHVIDQSSKSQLINRAVCLSGCLHVREKNNPFEEWGCSLSEIAIFILFNIKNASLQGEQISRLRIPFKSILLSYKYHLKFDRFSIYVLSIYCLFHLSKQPLLTGEIFIVFKTVLHMLIFVTQCSSSFNNVLVVLTILAKKQETWGKLQK